VNERKARRQPLSYWLRVFDADQDEPLGNLADITSEGFSVMSEQRGTPGTVVTVRMQLPSEMDGPKELEVAARIRWSRPGSPKGFNRLGFQFVDVDDSTRAVIDRLIREFPYHEPPEDDGPFFPQELP
jgi:hypothetical protein